MKNTALSSDRKEAREYQTASSGLFFKARKVLYEKKSAFQKIEIIENDFYGRVLFLDGLVQTTEKDEFFYHEMLVHPALACLPHPEKVLVIGGGDGGALREVLKHPVKKAWLVEIDQEVIRACERFFPWLEAALSDPRAEPGHRRRLRFHPEDQRALRGHHRRLFRPGRTFGHPARPRFLPQAEKGAEARRRHRGPGRLPAPAP